MNRRDPTTGGFCTGAGPVALRLACATLGALLGPPLPAQQGDRNDQDRSELPPGLVVPAAPALDPQAALGSFRLADGYRIELVASEPLIGDPVQAAFDARGRLWVVEMRSYMRDVSASDELRPDGRVVVLTDEDGDGAMDRAQPFLDGLVLPRAVLPLPGGALVLAPPELLWVPDADGDLRADAPATRRVVCDGFDAGLKNPEHSGNGLLWGIDNRIHLANDARMLRWDPTVKEAPFVVESGAGGGQWGISQDDRGRLFFNYNSDWLRCDLVPGRYATRRGEAEPFAGLNHRVVQDASVWPVRVTPGVNRGGRPGLLDDEGRLTQRTAVCAPLVYRGTRLGDCDGDVFVCEPAANLVRRIRLRDHDARLRGANPYERAEFLASTDERFRPVNQCLGPDGALYVVDMYRGVIQHRNFVTTFLRKQIEARGLERPIGLGRIWRVVPDTAGAARRDAVGVAAAPADLESRPTAELVALLEHDNGWHRDQAQQLLVLRRDQAAVAPLRALLRRNEAPATSRIQALTALAALDALGHDDLRAVLHGGDPGVLATALGFAAPFLTRGDAVLWSQCEALAGSAVPSVRWHLLLALGDVRGRHADRAVQLSAVTAARDPADDVARGCALNAAAGREPALVRALLGVLPKDGGDDLLRAVGRAVGHSRDPERQWAFLDQVAACMQTQRQRALLEGLCAALPEDEAERRGFFVFAATPPALQAIARTGAPEVTGLVQQILASTTLRPTASAEPAGTALADADLTPDQRGLIAAGGRVYAAYCAACHQPSGRGMPGLAPPLRGSKWVTGDPERLIKVALHGLRGPLQAAGTDFDGEMPGQQHLSDPDLAAALSWLRRAWSHGASPVSPADVAAVRAAHDGRQTPWPAGDLAPR